jgi:hypothetical protein
VPRDQREVRTFGTTTAGLLALGEWLAELECTHVAMESAGHDDLSVGSVAELVEAAGIAVARSRRVAERPSSTIRARSAPQTTPMTAALPGKGTVPCC